MASERVTATARDIEQQLGIPAGRVRAYASEGRIPKPTGRPARYDVRAVLAERGRAADTIASWAGS